MKRLLFAFVCALALPASAQENPVLITHMGRLLGNDDAPITGLMPLTIGLYATADAEVAQWSETYQVTLAGGTYAIVLGDTKGLKKPLPAAVAAANPFLGVTVDQTPLVPRLRLGTVPFAVEATHAAKAGDSDRLGTVAAADYALKSGVAAQLAGYAALGGATFTGAVLVPTPGAPTSAATKSYVDQAVAAATPTGFARLDGATFTGAVIVPTPGADAHAANRGYVDGKLASLLSDAPLFAPGAGSVPFAVSAGAAGVVTNLNAELLGGRKASDFVLASQKPAVVGAERLVLDFEEGTSGGTAVNDSSGAGNHGAFASNSLTRAAAGHNASGALTYSAAGGMVSVPDADSLDLANNVTMEAWIYPTAAPGSESIIVLKEGAYALRLSPTRQVEAAIKTAVAGTGTFVAASVPVPLNTWTHVAASYDGLQIGVFLNGALSSMIVAPNGPVSVTTTPLTIGGRTGSTASSFIGTIDEVRVSAVAKAHVEHTPAYAQYGAAGWAPSSADTVVPWGKTFFETGITRTGNNLRFAKTGAYLISAGARVSGTGDIWQAWALFKGATLVAMSNGFGSVGPSDQGQQMGTFIAIVDSTTDDYQVVLRKANGAGAIVDSQWGDFSGTRAVITKLSL